jgi:hypothetical protein
MKAERCDVTENYNVYDVHDVAAVRRPHNLAEETVTSPLETSFMNLLNVSYLYVCMKCMNEIRLVFKSIMF